MLREHAEDKDAFDAFTKQWYFEVVVPRYTIDSATKTRVADAAVATSVHPSSSGPSAESDAAPSAWEVEFELTNRGTSTMPVEIAAVRGERWPKGDAKPGSRSNDPAVLAASTNGTERAKSANAWQESRASTTLGAGETKKLHLRCAFEPERLVVDPDAKVLMLERKKAERKL